MPLSPVVTEPSPDLHAEAAIIQATGERHEKAAVSSGQRRINAIWEITQAVIALSVTGVTLYVAARIAGAAGADTQSFLLLSNAFFLVIGFYFGRTNHTRMGGVGVNQTEQR